MADQWEFTQDDQQLWRWSRLAENSARTESTAAFAQPVDCYLDAVRHAVHMRRPDTGGEESAQTH